LQGLAADVDLTTLALGGTYYLVAEGSVGNSGSNGTYRLNVNPVTVTPSPLTLGATVNGSIASPGGQAVYTFTLADKARLYFDALTTVSLSWKHTGPGGDVTTRSFTSADGASSSNPVLALPTGAYTLTIDAAGDATPGFSFVLFDLATAAPLTP